MLVSDDFVYLHMPKTGGGTITGVLRDVLPAGYVRNGPQPHVHPGWRWIPEQASALPVFVHVRNPWDWYVSWYEFSRRRREPTTKRLWVSAFADEPDFPTFLRRACTGGLDHDRPEIADALRAGGDFYTVRWLDLVGGIGEQQLVIGRYERLFGDLDAFLRRVGAPAPEDFCEQAAASPRVHPGQRGAYRDYYDATTRDLVERCAAHFIERFGYEF